MSLLTCGVRQGQRQVAANVAAGRITQCQGWGCPCRITHVPSHPASSAYYIIICEHTHIASHVQPAYCCLD
jgi:hypothetical protein